MAVAKIKLKFYVNPGKKREDDCYCSYANPDCEKGYKGDCLVIKHTINPYANIEECQANEQRTYKKVHGRTRAGRT